MNEPKEKWVPASKMKGMTTKRKEKKPRRVVLGIGYPFFRREGSRWGAVVLTTSQIGTKPRWGYVELKFSDLGNYNRIRLVAEVLK